MARAYSLDLRERVVAAVVSGQSCRLVAKTFMVSVASVVTWSQRQRAVGRRRSLIGDRALDVRRGWYRLTRRGMSPFTSNLIARQAFAELATAGRGRAAGRGAQRASLDGRRSGRLLPERSWFSLPCATA
jgi:Transposase